MYEEILNVMKLPSLKFRRKRGDFIELYKYIEVIQRTTSRAPNIQIRSTTSRAPGTKTGGRRSAHDQFSTLDTGPNSRVFYRHFQTLNPLIEAKLWFLLSFFLFSFFSVSILLRFGETALY